MSAGGGSGASGGFPAGGTGGAGFVRVEAFNFSAFSPSVPTNSSTFAPPNPVTVTNGASLRIASVAGVSAPATPIGFLAGAPDIVLPPGTPNPVTIAIQAANIPLATVVQVALIPTSGPRTTAQATALAGTAAASTASASMSLPNGMSVLVATATIDVSQSGIVIDGERVNKVEIAATFGGASDVTYVTQSGRRIKKAE